MATSWKTTAAKEQKIRDLAEDDRRRLDAQRALIEQYLDNDDAQEKYKKPVGKLGLLRDLLRANVFPSNQTYQLQSMGVVLGDVFVQDMGFHWVVVEDEYGQDPALQYRDTSIILYPLTMISKRIQRGEQVEVFDLYNGLAAEVEKLIEKGHPCSA